VARSNKQIFLSQRTYLLDMFLKQACEDVDR